MSRVALRRGAAGLLARALMGVWVLLPLLPLLGILGSRLLER